MTRAERILEEVRSIGKEREESAVRAEELWKLLCGKFVRGHGAGITYADLARASGVDAETVRQVVRRGGYKGPRGRGRF